MEVRMAEEPAQQHRHGEIGIRSAEHVFNKIKDDGSTREPSKRGWFNDGCELPMEFLKQTLLFCFFFFFLSSLLHLKVSNNG